MTTTKTPTTNEINQETDRLFRNLEKVGWTEDDCALIAPMTLEINTLKKEQNAIILAHSYQTPDIMYGIADFIGDSYALSRIVTEHEAKKVVFCSVHFMGETAKLLNPDKEVLVPAVAGCSLAESITPEDVRALREKHPNAAVVCYVNTTAAVKAECDYCCTSSNVVSIVEAIPYDEIIFIPDEFMGKNLRSMTEKTIHTWTGRCIVHETFTPDKIDEIRLQHPDVKILAHTECSPAIIAKVDVAGGTAGMLNYIRSSDAHTFMVITECGLTDRIRTEFPDKEVVGTCSLCPYMKKIMLKDILKALKNPSPDQIIIIDPEIATQARKSLDNMFKLEETIQQLKIRL
ncbi:MAG: quinolinate synthase NadA [bacterium]